MSGRTILYRGRRTYAIGGELVSQKSIFVPGRPNLCQMEEKFVSQRKFCAIIDENDAVRRIYVLEDYFMILRLFFALFYGFLCFILIQ